MSSKQFFVLAAVMGLFGVINMTSGVADAVELGGGTFKLVLSAVTFIACGFDFAAGLSKRDKEQ